MGIMGGVREDEILSDVGDLVSVYTLDVILLHQCLDVLLDVRDLGREAGLDLLNDFLHELDVLHLLARLHDAHNGGLREKQLVSCIPSATKMRAGVTYLEQQLPILLDGLVSVLSLHLLLGFDLDVEVDLDLLIFEVVIQGIQGGGLGLRALRIGSQHPSLQENGKVGVEDFRNKVGRLLDIRVG